MKIDIKKDKKIVMVIGATLLLSLIVAGIFVLVANSSGEKLAEQLELGQKYLDELDYEQAIVAYEAAIEIDPKCEEAYLALAEAYLQMGEYDKAMECASLGYSQTGSEILLGKMGEIQKISEEEAAYGERIVDGIYHHGYAFYDLADEEETLLDELISYTETGRYEEYAVKTMNEDRYIQAWRGIADKYEDTSEDGAHIAYKGYKIAAVFTDEYDLSQFLVSLIPIEDGIGALYYLEAEGIVDRLFVGDGTYAYTYCECVNGMFNGACQGDFKFYFQFPGYPEGFLVVGWKGEVRNGLMQGRCSRFFQPLEDDQDVNGDGVHEVYSIYDNGVVTKFEENGMDLDGRFLVAYNFHEDGNAAAIVSGESFNQAREVLESMRFYIMPGYESCIIPSETIKVGDDSGIYVYPY